MTPEEFSALYARRAAELGPAIRRGTRNVLLSVERAATKNLSGSGSAAAGSYPVPIRTGNLRRSMGVRQESETVGFVFNRARYAGAIHRGMTPYNNPRIRKSYLGRPFLDDAAASVDSEKIFRESVLKHVFQRVAAGAR